jgi:hypothetical protein
MWSSGSRWANERSTKSRASAHVLSSSRKVAKPLAHNGNAPLQECLIPAAVLRECA